MPSGAFLKGLLRKREQLAFFNPDLRKINVSKG
jgi:hypothetical protein